MIPIHPENYGSMVNIVSGSQMAAAGTFNPPVLDLSPFEGNAVIMFSVDAAGTGTLNVTAQEGTAAVSTWSPIGTGAIFTTDGSASGTAFAQVIAGSPRVQVRAINLEKVNQFLRFNITSVDSGYKISIAAFLPRKYANADTLG